MPSEIIKKKIFNIKKCKFENNNKNAFKILNSLDQYKQQKEVEEK